ncbi:MAG: HoxN/HupN/NixA family nickel/cobalt transporter [Treponema sp.]
MVLKKQNSIFLLLCTCCMLYANPFTKSQTAPAPVRTGQPSEFITAQQAMLHTRLGEYLYEWSKTNSTQAFWSIMGLAFLYGFLHALGPGHRKTIVFSFYLTRAAPIWEPLVTSVVLAGLHGITTICLLLLFRNAKGTFSGNTASAVAYLEGISFLVLLLLSLFSLLHLFSHVFPEKLHWFHFGCGCGAHTHGHDGHECAAHHEHSLHRHEHSTRNARIQWAAFVLSGIYPCPAALLVLVLVLSLDALGLGIIAVVSMSVGMVLPIMIVAYLAWAGRERLFHRLRAQQKYMNIITLVLGVAAYGFIFVFSCSAVKPFLMSFFR